MDNTCDLLCLDLPKAEAVRAALPDSEVLELASAAAQSLADPTRLNIAAALSHAKEACVCDLAWITARAQNLVSHHLRTLRSAALVTSRRQGKMVLYSLTPTGKKLVKAVLLSLDAQRARV